jgi:tRNA (guanosine-2'-O-)-methyltransferase
VTNSRRVDRITQTANNRLKRVSIAIEAVHHRHNISAILRTADSLGIATVHLITGDFRAARGAARGAERWLTIHKHPSTLHAISQIHAEGRDIYVADIADDALVPTAVPVNRPLCLWFGAEHAGVSPEAIAASKGTVSLPMHGMAQSLNVSVAAALISSTVSERARALGPDALLSKTEAAAQVARWLEREDLLVTQIKARG